MIHSEGDGFRRATHAGSWYTDNGVHPPSCFRLLWADDRFCVGGELDHELTKYLSAVEPSPEFSPPIKRCKAIIAPFVVVVVDLH